MGAAGRAVCLIFAVVFLLAQFGLELYLYWVATEVIGFWPVVAIVLATIIMGILFKIAIEGAS